jgi:hypothetical protein
MKELDKDRAYWFVVGSMSVNREIQICDDLRLKDIECFVPLRYEVKVVRRRKQETLVPAIRGLLFIHDREEAVEQYIASSKHRLFFRKFSYADHKEKMTVDDQQMARFMAFVTENQERDLSYYSPEEVTWQEGETVRVTIGTKKYEGQIVRIKGKRRKQFVVSIPDLAYAAIELTPDLLEEVSGNQQQSHAANRQASKQAEDDRDDHRSKNLELDKRILFEKAFKLLFVLTGQQTAQIREYQVTKKELVRVMKRVAPYKGYTNTLEAELALPLFMGAWALGDNTEGATERLKTSLEKLPDTSMLKFRMRFYLAKVTHDEQELARIMEIVKGWNHRKLQRKQQAFMDEAGGLFKI